MNFVIDFNSKLGIEKGFLFNIIGNQYAKLFIDKLISKKIVNRRIKHVPCLIGDILFDVYTNRGYKYEDENFIISDLRLKVVKDYFSSYFLIARLALTDEKNDLIKEFKMEKTRNQDFNFYFSIRELGLFEEIDTKKMKELGNFKDLLKSNDFYIKEYYDYNVFAELFKKKLNHVLFGEDKKLNKQKRVLLNKFQNTNLSDTFYSFVILEKYYKKENLSKKKREYIDRFLNDERYSINNFNHEFGKNKLEDTVNFIIDEGIANPNKSEFHHAVERLVKFYDEKDFNEDSVDKLEEYLEDNGILENKKLEEEITNSDYNLFLDNQELIKEIDDEEREYSELGDFGLFKNLDLEKCETVFAMLQYLKKEEDCELNDILKKLCDDLENILGNNYLIYLSSFFFDLRGELDVFLEYYIQLYDDGLIDDFYHNDWEELEITNPDIEDFQEELFNNDEIQSIEKDFIISTNDFLQEWDSYYNIFKDKILKKKNELKLIGLMVLFINDSLGKNQTIRSKTNLNILNKFIIKKIDEIIIVLDDLKFLNDHLENIVGKEMKNQYNTIRKYINKWKRNVSQFKRKYNSLLLD